MSRQDIGSVSNNEIPQISDAQVTSIHYTKERNGWGNVLPVPETEEGEGKRPCLLFTG